MKYILLFKIFLSICFYNIIDKSFEQSPKPKLKMIKEFSYTVKNNEMIDREKVFNLNPESYTKYDEKENILEFGFYNNNGDIIVKYLYERNLKDENLIKISKISLSKLKDYSI